MTEINTGAPIYNLYVYPTYCVKMKQRDSFKPSKESIEKANEARKLYKLQSDQFFTEANTLPPVISAKAKRRLTNSVNWLISSAKTKTVFSKSTGKNYSFKVSFITLTLPCLDHGLSDAAFKNKLLHTFISNARNKWQMVNFVWKCEAQKNGNIHVHITTDVFINWQELRSTWNKILSTYGLIEIYCNKHKNMPFEEYNFLYNPSNDIDIETMRIRYEAGKKCNWTNPNTTDVHSVHKVKDIGAYLAKYFEKEEVGRRRIIGRVWSCSYSLSSKNKLVVEAVGSDVSNAASDLYHPDIKQKEIIQTNKLTGAQWVVGVIYFYKLSDWGKIIKNTLLAEYNAFRFSIRNNLPAGFLSNVIIAHTEQDFYNGNPIDLMHYQPN